MNVFKAGIPLTLRPIVGAVAGATDMLFYIVVLNVENGEHVDGVLEWSQRLSSDVWAMGSAYNSRTGGLEPWGFAITAIAGGIMHSEAVFMAKAHYKYWEENADKEEYNPPSITTGINGSLW